MDGNYLEDGTTWESFHFYWLFFPFFLFLSDILKLWVKCLPYSLDSYGVMTSVLIRTSLCMTRIFYWRTF